MTVKIAWALNKDSNSPRHISDVENGKGCNCHCPDCGEDLYARHGKGKVAPHFYHAKATDCAGEGALHFCSKYILASMLSTKGVSLPGKSGKVRRISAGKAFESIWKVHPFEFVSESARIEEKVAEDLRADLIAEDANKAIAFEIAVTNFKNPEDIAKYRDSGVEAVEIDLSDLVWNAGYEELLKAFSSQRRYKWLNRNDIRSAVQCAEVEVKDAIEEEKLARKKALVDLLSDARANSDYGVFNNVVEPLRVETSDVGAFGESIQGIGEARPLVRSVASDWRKDGDFYIAEGLTDKNVEITILVIPYDASADEVPINTKRPTLIVERNLESKKEVFSYSYWTNVDHWVKALRKRAKKDAFLKKQQSISRKKQIDDFAKKFKLSAPEQQLKTLMNKFDFHVEYSLKNYSRSWGAHDTIWKLLVWHYKIQRKKSVSIDLIASDTWLASLIGFRMDDAQYQGRCNELWRWFQILLGKSVLRQGYRGSLEVMGKLPHPVPGIDRE